MSPKPTYCESEAVGLIVSIRRTIGHFNFVLGRGGDVVAAGIIVSRENGNGSWLRNNCQLVLNEDGFGSDLTTITRIPHNAKQHFDL